MNGIREKKQERPFIFYYAKSGQAPIKQDNYGLFCVLALKTERRSERIQYGKRCSMDKNYNRHF